MSSPSAAAPALASTDGTPLAHRSWSVGRPLLSFAVVHGLGEHSGRYERFAHGMAAFQMATYAVDLRGHGQSAGQRGHVDSWSQWVDDTVVFVRHVEATADGEVVPVGHSFGGAVVLSAILAGRLPHIRRFIVSSPALRLKARVPGWKTRLGDVASRVAPRLAMSNEVDPATVSRIPEVVEAYRTDPLVHSKISSRTYTEWRRASADILARAGAIRMPFLILAGSDDALIDPEGSRLLHDRTREVSELHLLPGRYHEPFNDVDGHEVFQLIEAWLRR